ncbi:DUF397 domain-containing protein [Saccharopolyspora sp. 5N102]|uniref:DUF397 domain-containing protein n=1 Tax=Saccharopolyspora sp. 5N102 TaxID=3375155 RepID=UPI0037989D7D
MPDTKHNYRAWRKSSRSNNQGGNCVEVGFSVDGGMTGVRDTKDRDGGTLEVPRSTWAAFLDAVRRGDVTA